MIVSATSARLRAQTQERVIHLWVDPVSGDDVAAAANNPVQPSSFSSGTAPLLHAPWPYKTVTAAIGSLPSLPYTDPQTGLIWKYAILHLLPGIYGPTGIYGTAATPNPANGLLPNGDASILGIQLPIDVPNNVSLQGTSALNTIFDRGGGGANGGTTSVTSPALRFGQFSNSRGLNSFVDSITFVGAWHNSAAPFVSATTCAAIHLSPIYGAAPTITNCVFAMNGVGILADCTPTVVHDDTIIANCTFAFNIVGVWNGEVSANTEPTTGWSKLVLLNNIFDASPDAQLGQASTPLPPSWSSWIVATSGNAKGFEGIDFDDLRVDPAPGLSYDSNAYEASKFDLQTVTWLNSGGGGGLFSVRLPPTRARANRPAAIPQHDIAPITNRTRRGILYVRDLLYTAPSPSPSAAFDRSPLDFRLCPGESDGGTQAPSAPGIGGRKNRLVNAGWYRNIDAQNPALMCNGILLTKPIGSLPLAQQSTWPYACIDLQSEDCEGFGNPRVHDYAGMGATPIYPITGVGGIDIGADELGELIIAGYRYGTTSFLALTGDRLPMTTPPIPGMDNKYVWHLGPPTMIPAANPIGPTPRTWLRPWFRSTDHLASPPPNYYQASNGYYPSWFAPWNFGNVTYYNSRVVDVVPHLIYDLHPWWSLVGPSSCNPIWQTTNPSVNLALYLDPGEQVINPPGSYIGDGIGLRWLDLTWQGGTLTPYALLAGFGGQQSISFRGAPNAWFITNFDVWCRGGVGVYPRHDTMPPTFVGATQNQIVAVRYTVEEGFPGPNNAPPSGARFTPGLGATNAQTFLVAVETPQQ